MTIIIPNNEFLKELFPDIAHDRESIENALIDYYTVGAQKPKVKFTDDFITVSLDIKKIDVEQTKYKKLISLCEASRFEEAKPLAEELTATAPEISEYHRILGQIYSELGHQEDAINTLIDALRWDPENEHALVMMGNIFSRSKNDVNTALTYYNQVLKTNPKDHISLNNIGANLMNLGKAASALTYFEKALKANPEYPNTHLALGLLAEKNGEYLEAFNYALAALKYNPKKDDLFKNSFNFLVNTAKHYQKTFEAGEIVDRFSKNLEEQTNIPIQIEEDATIPTAAKIEYAQSYDRNYHLVRYKSQYPAVEHLILHELMHLQLATEAREEKVNKLFTSNSNSKNRFLNAYKKYAVTLAKKGVDQASINNYFTALFDGINSQVFNTPIDLFIEDRIYKDFEALRPFQFLSLYNLIQEGIQATTNPEIVKNAPSQIISKSKIYNLTNALLFKDLYQLDLTNDHKPTKAEIKQAREFFKEFEEYRRDKEPGEEYELIQHWGEDLQLDSYFELVPEDDFRRKTVDEVMSDIDRDPLNLESSDPAQEKKMKDFLKNHSSEDTNQAVVMYMVDALQFFEKHASEEIKKIAFEFATLGMAGIDPKKQSGYDVPSIPGSNFSGYKTLAYYYVSWALAIPEMLSQLQMPFDKEYDLAKQLTNL
ncbi:tetratricopeptide repeat protein [Salegentibacter maritimus]|uniref:tetratricopeptide repeat protein n=1 Tax=Salegentibacter maritimus TaxID=2794347 RepID=UPI0018E43E4F|nr:tetratricopeptide repeat protein [Salegentibacter maritimus]MBI6115985.1 tetratricopeptide repeat protein [Salegentibacter maritimus]